MTTGVVSVGRDATLADAAERFLVHGVGSVVIVGGDGAPVGILPFTDIVYHLSGIRREAGELASARDQWESEERRRGAGATGVIDAGGPWSGGNRAPSFR